MSDLPVAADTAVEPAAAVGQSSALRLLRAAVLELATLAADHRGDPVATGAAVVHLETLLRDLRSVLADLKHWTADAWPARTTRISIPGVGTVERAGEGGGDRWDDVATMLAVIDHERSRWTDVDGESVPVGRIAAPTDVPAVLLEYMQVGYWRKGRLREAGIEPAPSRDEDGSPIPGTGLYLPGPKTPSVRVTATDPQIGA